MKMHSDQAHVDAGLVTHLVAAQFPRLAGLPVTEVSSAGTVNAIFRLGAELSVRLSLTERWSTDLEREWQVLRELAPLVSIAVPEPVAMGDPSGDYPLPWAIYRWIPGRPYADALVSDERLAARELARFVTELRAVPLDGAPRAGRKPLAELDAMTRADIEAAADEIDAPAALSAWERVAEGPAWDGKPTWIHADLLRPNLLVDAGELQAVIDFGMAGAGDPAHDVIAAWSVFGPAGRAEYRHALAVDDDTWNRGRGIALHQAAAIIPYYRVTNPGLAASAKRTVEQILTNPLL